MSPGGLGRERRRRHRARAWILQIHYRWVVEGQGAKLADTLERSRETRRIAPDRLPYIERVTAILDEHLEEIDEILEEALDNWRLDRLAVMDRGVLRLATAEMLHMDDIPPKVSILEGILLAERYGGPDSPRFVNGVLDAISRRREGDIPL